MDMTVCGIMLILIGLFCYGYIKSGDGGYVFGAVVIMFAGFFIGFAVGAEPHSARWNIAGGVMVAAAALILAALLGAICFSKR